MKEHGKQGKENFLIFNKDKFTVSENVKLGFKPVTFLKIQDDKGWSFKATVTSNKEGNTTWKGKVSGNKINE